MSYRLYNSTKIVLVGYQSMKPTPTFSSAQIAFDLDYLRDQMTITEVIIAYALQCFIGTSRYHIKQFAKVETTYHLLFISNCLSLIFF